MALDMTGTVRSAIAVAATGADNTITLDPSRTYDLINLGVQADGTARTTTPIFGSTNGSAVEATNAEGLHKLRLMPSAEAFGNPVRISGVTTLKLKSTGQECCALITQSAHNRLYPAG